MKERRFFCCGEPLLLSDIASRVGGDVRGEGAGDVVIRGVATLESASCEDISFFNNRKYASAFAQSQAGACCVLEKDTTLAPDSMALLVTPHPYLAYARIGHMFYAENREQSNSTHASAVIASSATLGHGCSIGAGVVIEDDVVIGDNACIGAHVVIGHHVVLGEACRIDSHVSINHAVIGDRVCIHHGARIGQEGFGFAPDGKGRYVTVPQLGCVVIGDDVVIGANTTIDRGSVQDTEIGAHCRIDNLVHIAHNVVLGQGCVIAGQVGISGSTRFGDYCIIGGQVGFSGHNVVGDGVHIAAKSGVMRDIGAGERVAGIPAVPVRQWHKQTLALERLAKQKKRREEKHGG
ncbi:MAG: UDP-3-O-(3-hydroxymyristoyl)glucosamine N-acyltransferase [Alphaproteobacteria bacterium GM7ARS4]|nr:UDP-3-O-(3-hydroxymyristoyl)glucosamine N-acyltransferase [Alphaproteobacteria bacterium GM7ARS4]